VCVTTGETSTQEPANGIQTARNRGSRIPWSCPGRDDSVRYQGWSGWPCRSERIKRNRFAFDHDSPRVGEPEMKARFADLCSWLGWTGPSWPRIVRRFIHIVLQCIKRLSADPNDVIFKSVTMEREVVSDERARAANVIVVLLAWKPTLITRVPQHPVGGIDMESRRDDLLESVSEQSSKIVRVHGLQFKN
jgi:hypothetical protein